MKFSPLRWRRAGGAALTAALVAAVTVVPAPAAQAQPGCLVADNRTTTWSTGEGSGGFMVEITITNVCDSPVVGWTLQLTLAPGHVATQGWSAQWSSSGDQLTATDLAWNRVLNPGSSVTIGFVGTWSGAYQDPLSCVINGSACDGTPEGNEPPEVTLTSPGGGVAGFLSPCPFNFTADASDPDGAVERVEFYVNDVLVGTDRTAPYVVGVGFGALPPPLPSWEYVAVARAYDTGAPPLGADSEPVRFRAAIGDPAPETITACTGSLALAAGSSEPFRFLLRSATVDEVTLTVAGDPGVTVSPTTVTPMGDLVAATVSAAPGSAGARATITAVAGDLRPASVTVTVLPPA